MAQPGSAEPFAGHFDGKRFRNPNGRQARGLFDVFRWKLTSRAKRSPGLADVEPSVPPRRVEGNQLLVTLINHSTVLLQQDGLNILTDPIWSQRASPVSWTGPRRLRIPGVKREDLPPIDVLLISHNHYDHLDLPSLRRLAQRKETVFVVPRGVAPLLRSLKIQSLYELDWGGSQAVHGATVFCVPALHFSGRGLFDRNKSLWCGYVIQSGERTTYFAGDTAFGEHFTQIRERFGAPDLSLLPVGAYEPRWFMSAIHMAPREAVAAHEALGSRASIAIHHGTFQLGDDTIDAPREQLPASARPDSFLILTNGQSVSIT